MDFFEEHVAECRFEKDPGSVSDEELAELEEFFVAVLGHLEDVPPGERYSYNSQGYYYGYLLERYLTLHANVLVEQQLRGI